MLTTPHKWGIFLYYAIKLDKLSKTLSFLRVRILQIDILSVPGGGGTLFEALNKRIMRNVPLYHLFLVKYTIVKNRDRKKNENAVQHQKQVAQWHIAEVLEYKLDKKNVWYNQ